MHTLRGRISSKLKVENTHGGSARRRTPEALWGGGRDEGGGRLSEGEGERMREFGWVCGLLGPEWVPWNVGGMVSWQPVDPGILKMGEQVLQSGDNWVVKIGTHL